MSAQTELEAIKKNNALMQIDDVLISLETMIESELQQPAGNPCRDEKIQKLTDMQRFLKEPYSSREGDIANFLRQRQDKEDKVNNFLASLPQYDEMIDIHDHLKKMETYVTSSTKLSPEVKDEQSNLLTFLQSTLVNRDKSPSERLMDVKKEGEDKINQKILNKNSDSLWTSLCKGFNNFLVKIGLKAPSTAVDQGKDLTSAFKNKLHNIKEATPSTPKPANDSSENDLDSEEEIAPIEVVSVR